MQPVIVFGMPCDFATFQCWTPLEQAQAPTLLSQRRHPPKPPKSTSSSKAEAHTTVMMRNVPISYSREMLLELLDRKGFARLYNFVYLPFDFLTQGNVGYAFIGERGAGRPVLAHVPGILRLGGEQPQGLQSQLERPRAGSRGEHQALQEQPGDVPHGARRLQAGALLGWSPSNVSASVQDAEAAADQAVDGGGADAAAVRLLSGNA